MPNSPVQNPLFFRLVRLLFSLCGLLVMTVFSGCSHLPSPSPSLTTASLHPFAQPSLGSVDPVFADYMAFWHRHPQPSKESYENARILLYKIVAGNKLSDEQIREADQLSLALEHARLMFQASITSLDTRQELRQAIIGAINLNQIRQHGPALPYPQSLQVREAMLPDPFNLELMRAMEGASPLKPIDAKAWKVLPSEAKDHLHLQALVIHASEPSEKLFLLFKSLPANSVVSVNGNNQIHSPKDAHHSYRVPLARAYPEQRKFTIDIHIPHPPQRFRLATPWLTRMNP